MPEQTEILWDMWGTPHIFAPDEERAAYALGWAQARSHGDLILRLYAEARGCAAEYFGEAFLESDRYVRTAGIPARGKTWYAVQSPPARAIVDAFAAGVNAYIAAHGDAIGEPYRAASPVSGADILAHMNRVIHFAFMCFSVPGAREHWSAAPASNGWAIAPARAAGGNAMLLGNPHLGWGVDHYRFYEAHTVTPDDGFYGATLIGFPGLAFGFNEYLAWTHTVNTYHGVTLYELTLQGDGYRFDGEVRAFEIEAQTMRVRAEDGSLREEPLAVCRSVHGPVIAMKDGKALALRVAGLDRPGMLDQLMAMRRATNLEQFEEAVGRLQNPMFNIIYADRAGNIMELFNGVVPVRMHGGWDYWGGVVPGDTSDTLWTEYHPYEDLPKVVNPDSGWLHNCNEPPWYMTIPYPLNPDDFPAYLAPKDALFGWFRPQRSQRMLLEHDAMTFDQMVVCKFSARSEVADRLLDDLIAAARASDSAPAKSAADVLAAWDRHFNAGSRGAALFHFWFLTYMQIAQSAQAPLFARPWDATAEPLTVPAGLGDPALAVQALEAAAGRLEAKAGSVDVAWGEMARMRIGEFDLPATGHADVMGVFRMLMMAEAPDGKMQSVWGDAFVFAVEFSDPLKASVMTVYGNATQPGSPHIGDQLEPYARDELHPALLARADIEANLELREVFE